MRKKQEQYPRGSGGGKRVSENFVRAGESFLAENISMYVAARVSILGSRRLVYEKTHAVNLGKDPACTARSAMMDKFRQRGRLDQLPSPSAVISTPCCSIRRCFSRVGEEGVACLQAEFKAAKGQVERRRILRRALSLMNCCARFLLFALGIDASTLAKSKAEKASGVERRHGMAAFRAKHPPANFQATLREEIKRHLQVYSHLRPESKVRGFALKGGTLGPSVSASFLPSCAEAQGTPKYIPVI